MKVYCSNLLKILMESKYKNIRRRKQIVILLCTTIRFFYRKTYITQGTRYTILHHTSQHPYIPHHFKQKRYNFPLKSLPYIFILFFGCRVWGTLTLAVYMECNLPEFSIIIKCFLLCLVLYDDMIRFPLSFILFLFRYGGITCCVKIV